MSLRLLGALLFISLVMTSAYKGIRQVYDSFEKRTISEHVCRASEARLQVGATREVVDVAHSALLAGGYTTAEVQLKSSGVDFATTKLSEDNSSVFKCHPEGIQSVELAIFFPKNELLTVDTFIAFIVFLVFIWILKILMVILIRGLQADLGNEIDKMLANSLGFQEKEIEKTPRWMKWLHELNPSSLKSFRHRLVSLENKIDRQAKELQSQAIEKAVKESQLIEARRFKDLVHQIRHDLRQTVGVVRSSFELMPTATNGRDVLKGAIGSLETMIGDLRERELKHEQNAKFQNDLVEVIIAESVNEQRIALSSTNAKIKFAMTTHSLHFISAPREELKRIITNLIVNASEAIEGKGQVEIETKEIDYDKISIRIRDNGIGFSEEALQNLFKKGFTTKKAGSGRGLSYAQIKIKEWGGRIFVESAPGSTVIEITLPAILADHLCHPSVLMKAQDIILVDDHPLDLSKVTDEKAKIKVFDSLATFEEAYHQKNISPETLIIFDLHLEEGRRAFEVLPTLASEQDFLFMTSDYLNPDLQAEAKRRQFLTIPKELIGLGLKTEEKQTTRYIEAESLTRRSETSVQI